MQHKFYSAHQTDLSSAQKTLTNAADRVNRTERLRRSNPPAISDVRDGYVSRSELAAQYELLIETGDR